MRRRTTFGFAPSLIGEKVKFFFKLFIGFNIFMYHLTGGKFGREIGPFKVLILTTKGRKSTCRAAMPDWVKVGTAERASVGWAI